MTSYKTFLNAVRVAISKAVNKLSARLARFEETATEKYNELAYVPIYETPLKTVWSGEITAILQALEGCPALEAGKEYHVTIGEEQWGCTAKIYATDGETGVYISDAENPFDGAEKFTFCVVSIPGEVVTAIFAASIAAAHETMTIQTIGDPVEVGKEWLHDYVDGKDTETVNALQELIKTAQSTAETAQSTAETAQSTAETAQSTAETAQSTAETAQSTINGIAMGFGTEIPSYKSNKEIKYAIFPIALTVSRECFSTCKNLKEVYIPSATYIGDYAFGTCTSLTSFIIPNSVTEISFLAFNACTSLTSVTIGSGVRSIRWEAFRYCTSLTSITYTGTMEQWNAITKGTDWNEGVPATEVVCSDGTVSLTTEEDS